jgi:hypothetical protein
MLAIMPKARISITIDSKTAHDIENYYRSKVKTAAENEDSIPKLSNVYEEIVTLGWESVKKNLKKK